MFTDLTMFLEEKHIRPGWVEEDLWIDLAILSFLREELLSGNLDFITLRDSFKEGFFSDIGCSWERFRRRSFYQVGLGYVDVHPIRSVDAEGCEVTSLDPSHNHKEKKGYLPPLRISPAGFMRIPEIERELIKYQGINRYITPIREQFQRVRELKWVAIAGLTTLLILSIFIFDIKVSKIINNIPLLGSVIDTELLEEFEAVNEEDAFYQALMTEDEDGEGSDTEQVATGSATPASTSVNGGSNTSTQKLAETIPPIVKKSLPPNVRVTDIKVKVISESERMFRISLENGVTRDIRVVKVGDRYRILENIDGGIRPTLRR